MTSHGPIALLGGGEHLPPCQTGDRRLLELTGATDPKVAVIPAASGPRSFPRTVGLALDHWKRLGAAVTIADPGRSDDSAFDHVAQADLIVLPGGHPDRLMRTLAESPLLALIEARWSNGAGLAGSSAGAMCLFRRRLRLYPPNPFGLRPGLGILDGVIVAPHFDRFRARRWARGACRLLSGWLVLGIDEDTALVGRSGSFRVYGSGGIVVASHREAVEFAGGGDVPHWLMGDRSDPAVPVSQHPPSPNFTPATSTGNAGTARS